MKKLTKLLALVLAAVMLLSCGAFAAEGDEEAPKELWIQWLNWETNEPEPQEEPHRGRIDGTPYDEFHVAIFACEGQGRKLTPVPVEKLKADEGLSVYGLCPGERGKEHYAVIRVKDWNKEYTISYNGYSMAVRGKLPAIGTYSAPEATVGNFLKPWECMYYTPVSESRTAYIIATDTDATAGRHLVGLAVSKDCEDKESFTLEKVSDNVYKVTLTDSIDIEKPVYSLVLDATWQHVDFMGGDTWTEYFDCSASAKPAVLYSEKQVPEYDRDNPTFYNDVKADFSSTLTMKAGEPKDIYLAFTYFEENDNGWVMRNTSPRKMLVSDSKLKVTNYVDEDGEFNLDFFKGTLNCDEPGTYTLMANTAYPEIKAMFHKDGRQYTNAELQKWIDETPWEYIDGELVIFTDPGTYENYVPFEEAFPGERVLYHVSDEKWCPLTVTVEPAGLPFTDVAQTDWFTPAVSFANSKGYMTGYPDGTFGPSREVTGAEFAQILYNKEGRPAAAEGASFQGATDDKWYTPAILWAAGKGIITDTGETAVEPEKALTRQQIALMLYNYVGKPEGTADLSQFTDIGQLSAWAMPAMEWAVSAKVFQGNGDGTLDPAGSITRAQTAQVLMNYFG